MGLYKNRFIIPLFPKGEKANWGYMWDRVANWLEKSSLPLSCAVQQQIYWNQNEAFHNMDINHLL